MNSVIQGINPFSITGVFWSFRMALNAVRVQK
jgi:hypothetical protein